MREVVVQILMFITGLLLVTGCAGSPGEAVTPERSECYAGAVRNFWICVEECRKEGRDYDDCDVNRLAREAAEQMEQCP